MRAFNKVLWPGMILLIIALPARAAFYKWVDEQGVTQYTEYPPPSGHYQEMRSPEPVNDVDAPQQPQTPVVRQNTNTPPPPAPGADDQSLAKQQAARRQNCQLARERLSQLENHPRVRITGADGSVRVMGEEEKQARLVETRRMVAQMCQ
jgi:hypothetical protein